jgi:hypothetical protein
VLLLLLLLLLRRCLVLWLLHHGLRLLPKRRLVWYILAISVKRLHRRAAIGRHSIAQPPILFPQLCFCPHRWG